jgi:hypothetical protein
MTKKHFIQLAKEIAAESNIELRKFACEVVIKVARQDNPRFDVERFRRACGL